MKQTSIFYIVLVLSLYCEKSNAQKLDLSDFQSKVGLDFYPIGSSLSSSALKPQLDNIQNGISYYSFTERIPDEIMGFNIARPLKLVAINDTIKQIGFSIIMDSNTFKNFTDTLTKKYGKPNYVDQDIAQVRIWNDGKFLLSVKYYPGAMTFSVLFGSELKATVIPMKWIYSERKGKGTGKLALNIKYFEFLTTSNFTHSQFEQVMPLWSTSGLDNSIAHSYNPITKKHDIPNYHINYEVVSASNKYRAQIETRDSLQKRISNYSFSHIKNPAIISTLKVDLINSGYKIDKNQQILKERLTGIKSDETIYSNELKGITLTIGKTVAGFYVHVY